MPQDNKPEGSPKSLEKRIKEEGRSVRSQTTDNRGMRAKRISVPSKGKKLKAERISKPVDQ